jgi:hypothetical protein
LIEEEQEEKGGEIIFLGKPRTDDQPRMHIGVNVECDDPETKARLQALINRTLGDPPEEEGDDP